MISLLFPHIWLYEHNASTVAGNSATHYVTEYVLKNLGKQKAEDLGMGILTDSLTYMMCCGCQFMDKSVFYSF